MSVNVTPHLNFRGRAREALEFYRSVFGGDLTAVSYADAGTVTDVAEADQIVWGQVSTDAGFRVMAYDVPPHLEWDAGTIPFFVSVRGNDAEEVSRYWKALAADDGSTVVADLAKSQWSPLYGMLRDRFGVTWVLDLEVQWNG